MIVPILRNFSGKPVDMKDKGVFNPEANVCWPTFESDRFVYLYISNGMYDALHVTGAQDTTSTM